MLRTLRQGFIEQHGSEPSVSLRYSDQSTSNSTISLRVGESYVNSEGEMEPSSSGSLSGQTKNVVSKIIIGYTLNKTFYFHTITSSKKSYIFFFLRRVLM